MMKQKILLFLLLMFANNVFAEEYKVSDCQIESSNLNTFVEHQRECVQDAIKNEQSEMMEAVRELPKAAVSASQDLWDIYQKLLMWLIIWIMLLNIVKAKVNKSFGDNKSEVVMKIAFSVLFVWTIGNTEVFKSIAVSLMEQQITNSLVSITAMNNLMAQSEEEIYNAADSIQVDVYQKADVMTNEMLKSEVCAMEFKQNLMSNYSFDGVMGYEADNQAVCIESYPATSFVETGRSHLNNAVKHCSSQFGNAMDCGKVYVKNENINQLVAAHNQKLVEWLGKSNAALCSKQDPQKAQAFCREYVNQEFRLIKGSDEDAVVDKQFVDLVRTFRSDYKEIIVDSVDATKAVKEAALLNILEQLIVLFTERSNTVDITNQMNDLIKSTIAISGYERSSSVGSMVNFSDSTVNVSVQNPQDFFNALKGNSQELFNNSALKDMYSKSKLITIISNPMVLFGRYAAEDTMEGFKLDLFNQRALFKAGLMTLTYGIAIKSLGSITINAAKDEKMKRTGVLISKVGSTLIMISVFAVAPFLLVAYAVMNAMMLLFTGLISLLITSIAMFYTEKSKLITILKELGKIIMSSFTKNFAVILAIVMSHATMVVIITLTLQMGVLQQMGLYTSLKQLITGCIVLILTILFSIIIFFKMILFIDSLSEKKTIFQHTSNNSLDKVDGVTQARMLASKANQII